MKNSWQRGETLTLTAPYDVASGAGFKVGLIFAIAASAALSGQPVEGQTVGVIDVLAVTADTAAGAAAGVTAAGAWVGLPVNHAPTPAPVVIAASNR